MSGADRRFRVVIYNSATNTCPIPQILSLEDLHTLLEHEETDCTLKDGTPGCRGKDCPQKDGLAWSAGLITGQCTCKCSAKGSRKGWCARCGGKTRLAAHVESLDVAIIDIDGISEQQRDEMCSNLEGIELHLHTTHTHLPPLHNFRLVLPFSRTVTPKEWEQLWFAIIRRFKLPDSVKKHGVDKSTRDAARLSYLPRAFRGRPFVNVRQDGVLLDPDELLRENLRHSREVLAAPQARGPQAEPGSVDLKDLKGFLRRYDPGENDPSFDAEQQKGAIIRRVLDEEPLAQRGFRGLTMLRAGTIVGWLLPINTPVEAALELLRPSISKTPAFDDDKEADSIEAWMASAQRGYEGAQKEKDERLAQEDSATGKLHAAILRKKAAAQSPAVVEPLVEVKADGPTPAPATPTPSVEEKEDDEDWRVEKLKTTTDKKGIVHTQNVAANLAVVLQNHRSWKNVLQYNELTLEPEAHGGPLSKAERESERVITAIRNWMVHNEELDQPQSEVTTYVEFVARERRYDPLRAYLVGLEHDGVSRIKSWLIDYCGARLETDDGVDVTKYVQMVGEKWLMAGAARGLYPGCKADNVLVFEGEQYAGKSMMLDILGGEWFADTKLVIGAKDAKETTCKSWVIELAELATIKRSETESQKAFFSQRTEVFRLSYAARVGKFKRRCIFAGTTNETQYLLDPTGNRRTWSVWCTKIDIPAIQRDRDQLWAEAVAKVRAGENCPNCDGETVRCREHRWWLDAEETAFAETVAMTRLKVDFADEIRTWWFSRTKLPEYLTLRVVLIDILGLAVDRREQHQVAIGRALKALGFERHHATVPGGREWVYRPSEKLLEETKAEMERRENEPSNGKQDRRSSMLKSVGAAKAPTSFAMTEPKDPV